MEKKLSRLVKMKFKTGNFIAIKIQFFKKDVDNDTKLVSKKISSGEKNFFGYMDDDLKIKPLHIMLPKMSAHVKGRDGETK